MVKALHSTLIGEIKKIRPDLPPIRKKIWNSFILALGSNCKEFIEI